MSDLAKTPVARGAKRGAGETRALVLRYYNDGLNPREIAALTGISTQAVYQHLGRLQADGEIQRRVERVS